MRVATTYQVNRYTNICVNANCPRGLPHWAGFGEPAHRRCRVCGQPLRRIRGEPRDSRHLTEQS